MRNPERVLVRFHLPLRVSLTLEVLCLMLHDKPSTFIKFVKRDDFNSVNGLPKQFEAFPFGSVILNLIERTDNDYSFGLDRINFLQPVQIRRVRKAPKRPLFYTGMNLGDSIRKFGPEAPCTASNRFGAEKQSGLRRFDLNENRKSHESTSARQVVRYFPARAF